MKVNELMTRDVATCRLNAPLSEACRIMWEHDLGFVPATDEDGLLQGVVTDRDACMAAYTQGRPLGEIPTAVAMSDGVQSCGADDELSAAHELMRKFQVRRLPVTDAGGRLVGVLSLNDLALAGQQGGKNDSKVTREVARTLGAVCEHRMPIEPMLVGGPS